jgi:hypothetical protein
MPPGQTQPRHCTTWNIAQFTTHRVPTNHVYCKPSASTPTQTHVQRGRLSARGESWEWLFLNGTIEKICPIDSFRLHYLAKVLFSQPCLLRLHGTSSQLGRPDTALPGLGYGGSANSAFPRVAIGPVLPGVLRRFPSVSVSQCPLERPPVLLPRLCYCTQSLLGREGLRHTLVSSSGVYTL